MENTQVAQSAVNRRDILKVGTLLGGALALGGLLSPANAAVPFKKPTRDNPLLLNYNENAYGYSPLVKKAIEKNLDRVSLYPESLEEKLYAEIANFYRIKPDIISLTNGSSAGIQASLYATNKMAKELSLPLRVIVPNPTFEFVEQYAKPLGVEVIRFNLDSNFRFDIDSMKSSEREFDGVSLVYICNPNNPTSSIIDANDLYSWIRNAKRSTIFVLDEAYAEFVVSTAFRSGIDMLKGNIKNTIVLRTFSKIYGLAGLRVGYVITTPELKRRIDEFLQFMGINSLGAAAAIAAIKDFNFRQYVVSSNIKSRQITTKGLDSLGLKYAPSHGNFIFHEITGNFNDFAKNMQMQNIVVGREFPRYENFCRVTLGTPEQMEYYVKTLKNFRSKRLV